jgi:hypothetical protein
MAPLALLRSSRQQLILLYKVTLQLVPKQTDHRHNDPLENSRRMSFIGLLFDSPMGPQLLAAHQISPLTTQQVTLRLRELKYVHPVVTLPLNDPNCRFL